jgi:hypothetical protein
MARIFTAHRSGDLVKLAVNDFGIEAELLADDALDLGHQLIRIASQILIERDATVAADE